jgi:hypothetical protein
VSVRHPIPALKGAARHAAGWKNDAVQAYFYALANDGDNCDAGQCSRANFWQASYFIKRVKIVNHVDIEVRHR